jgi:hypothetical protein
VPIQNELRPDDAKDPSGIDRNLKVFIAPLIKALTHSAHRPELGEERGSIRSIQAFTAVGFKELGDTPLVDRRDGVSRCSPLRNRHHRSPSTG